MSYATYQEVGQVAGFTFDITSSPVSSDQVAEFIEQIGSEMRGALDAGGYDTDPTDTNAVNVLRLYCSLGSAAMVMQARKSPDDAAAFQRRYDAWMTLVRQGKAGLPTSGSVSALPTSRYVKYPSTYPAHAFKRSEVQW